MLYNLIEYLNLDSYENVYVVGDLHGCYDDLMAELEKLNFDFDKDLLLSVGDTTDRGVKNEECVLLLGKSWFKAVRGNHEQTAIDGYYDEEIQKSHTKKGNGGAWFYALPRPIQKYIIDEFEKLPIAMEIQYKGKTYGIVHAEVPYDDWDLFKKGLLAQESIGTRTVQDCAMRNRATFKKDYVDIKNIDKVYLGHSVSKGIKYVGNCSFIDTGAVFGRYLTIVRLGD